MWVHARVYVGVNGGYWRVTYFWDPKVSCFHLAPQRQTNRLWTLLSQRAEEADTILVCSPCLFTRKHHLDVPKSKYTAWCFLLRFTMEDCTLSTTRLWSFPQYQASLFLRLLIRSGASEAPAPSPCGSPPWTLGARLSVTAALQNASAVSDSPEPRREKQTSSYAGIQETKEKTAREPST